MRSPSLSRRSVLKGSLSAGAAVSFPAIVPATALGRDGGVAASERITLGVIGIGPRCTYDLKSMLAERDMRCVAIADVVVPQATPIVSPSVTSSPRMSAA